MDIHNALEGTQVKQHEACFSPITAWWRLPGSKLSLHICKPMDSSSVIRNLIMTLVSAQLLKTRQ